jgi:hypothetical protein
LCWFSFLCVLCADTKRPRPPEENGAAVVGGWLVRDEGIPHPTEFLPSDPHPLGGLQGLGDNASEKHRHRYPTKPGLVVEPLDQVRMQLRLVRARMWHGLVAELSPSPAHTGTGKSGRSLNVI